MQKEVYQQSEHSPITNQEKEKFTVKDIVIIVFAWLMALSLVYICYLKFSILIHH